MEVWYTKPTLSLLSKSAPRGLENLQKLFYDLLSVTRMIKYKGIKAQKFVDGPKDKVSYNADIHCHK